MRTLRFYRYFLCVRPDPYLYSRFHALAEAVGQPVHLGRLHLTLCVIGQCAGRDHFMTPRVRRVLDGQPLHSFPIKLSRISTGQHGAAVRTFGRQDEIQDFYDMLVRLLRTCGIEPLYRKAGLRPHMTLGYHPRPAAHLPIALEWYPAELLLIESEVGLTRHNVLGRWPLSQPRQRRLPFDEYLTPQVAGSLTAVTGPYRRSAA